MGPMQSTSRGLRLGAVMLAAALIAIGLVPTAVHAASNTTGDVPAESVHVYLATALACSKLNGQSASFTPLHVLGTDYVATVEPVEGCRRATLLQQLRL